ncbi:hypothetical protein GIB67_017888 [Kingdonia uniflora]|uniref:Transmembrane protein n=1 Tax=Kingdonia uniflora TaxID=39325 RepID=A0A7J7MKX0_9MAGN|nr:hypothetical protein GIB67_017888 [Kingdonia uniflora]
MATPTLLFLSLFITIFTIGAQARPGFHFHPCKTLLISSFTISSSFKPNLPNPNSQIDQNPSRIFTIFTETNQFYPKQQREDQSDSIILNLPDMVSEFHPDFLNFDFKFPHNPNTFRSFETAPRIPRPVIPFESPFVTGSLRERTKDILSVVVALLFGAGCGALTSATMYLAWSMFANRYEPARGSDDDESDYYYEYDDVSPKKGGYAKVPADAPVAAAAAPENEVLPFRRTKDILSVVVALFFKAGCGTLTYVKTYLVWSLSEDSIDD